MRARGPRHSPVGRRPGRVARGGSASFVQFSVVASLIVILVGCNGATVSSPAVSSPTAASLLPGTELPSALSSGGGSDRPSTQPSTSPSQPTARPSTGPTDEASTEPSPEPTATESPTDTQGPGDTPSAGGPDTCFGSAQTRDQFFGTFATDVSWPVYCAVLPKGWSVEDGHFQLKNGGRLWIVYRRRSDGAKVVLDEGSVCADTTPCVPSGDDLGMIPFGDRQAAFSSTTGGGLSAVVDQTENPAWLLTGSGIEPKDFKTIAGRLHLLDQ